jgi:hypothetical protein
MSNRMNPSRYRLIILALPLLIIPAWEYYRLAKEVQGHVHDYGVVVGHVSTPPGLGYARYSSVIEYRGLNGEPHRFISNVQEIPEAPIGSKVEILVEPVMRRSAYVAGAIGHWFSFLILAPLSISFYIFIVLISFFQEASPKNKNRRSSAHHKNQKDNGAGLSFENGMKAHPKSKAELGELLDTLGLAGNEFAVLTKDKHSYIQAIGKVGSGFIIEYCDNGPKNKFVSVRKDVSLAEVKNIFSSFYFQDLGWKTDLKWEKQRY